jgi:hypothetical protein
LNGKHQELELLRILLDKANGEATRDRSITLAAHFFASAVIDAVERQAAAMP